VKISVGWLRLYLAVILDAFSRKVVGWAMKERLTGDLTLDALDMAYQQRKPPTGVMLHSDRGNQYVSSAYQPKLKRMGALPGTSGNCLENAVAERFFPPLRLKKCRINPTIAKRRQDFASLIIWRRFIIDKGGTLV
jgi:putative transposase